MPTLISILYFAIGMLIGYVLLYFLEDALRDGRGND